jgi:hypothetical protein
MFQTLIASATVGAGGATNIDFASIPGTFTDLVLVISARSGSAGDTLWIRFNNDSSTICTDRWLVGDGSSTSTSTSGGSAFLRLGTITSGDTSGVFNNFRVTIPNYSGSTNKSISTDAVNENNGTTAYQRITAGVWPITSAITRITISNNGSSISQHSTAYLYGTLKGSGGATVS